MLRDRSVLELVVLLLTATVCFSIVASGAAIAIVEIRDPHADTTTVTHALFTIISAILGAVLGLLAGKTGRLDTRTDDD